MSQKLFSAVWILTVFLAVTAAQALPAAADSDGGQWRGPDDRPLPFRNVEEILEFLRTAEVISRRELTDGINRPLKVRLRQDGVEANAIFRIVDTRKRRAKIEGRILPDFHDSYRYECAAWEVSRLLGLDNVPPCVGRRLDHRDGTMQLWVENTMTEKKRREKDIKPPDQLSWMRQKQTMKMFDALIYNFDRNQGNMLIDSDWKLWFIDHTRSFRKSSLVEKLEKIVWCEREIFERLQSLDRSTLSRRLKPWATSLQVSMLLKRRDKLVDHLSSRIDETRVSAVLWDSSNPTASSAELMPILDDDDIPLTSPEVQ